jgi:beta-alanine--pyruvate transaminase
MPYTANRNFKQKPRIITGASGAYYRDADGREILAGMKSC